VDSGTGVKTTQKKQAAIERDGYQSAVGNGCENAPLSDHSPPLESPPDSTRKAAVPPMIHSPSPSTAPIRSRTSPSRSCAGFSWENNPTGPTAAASPSSCLSPATRRAKPCLCRFTRWAKRLQQLFPPWHVHGRNPCCAKSAAEFRRSTQVRPDCSRCHRVRESPGRE